MVELTYQIIKYSLSFLHDSEKIVNVDIISLYRSGNNPNDSDILSHIQSMFDPSRICIISGDFNLDIRKQSRHLIIQELKKMMFDQKIETPTHVQGGIIDHLYIYYPQEFKDVLISYETVAAFYTDHFGISITLHKGENKFRQIKSSISEDLIRPNNEEDSRAEKEKTKHQ